MICILDYGSGNVGSVFNVLKFLGYDAKISNKESDLKNSTHLILPGVGAFNASMEKIVNKIPMEILENEVIKNGKPFLGICVGMQVLADLGVEGGNTKGFGWISGEVKLIDSANQALPHMGWNNIEIKKDTPIFNNFKNISDFYFVHSYAFFEEDEEHVLAKVEYGSEINAVINKDNIYGFQFHPEKSQRAGQLILKNFLSIQ